MSDQDCEPAPEVIRKESNSSQKLIEKEEDNEDFGNLTKEEVPSETEDVLEGKEPGTVGLCCGLAGWWIHGVMGE